MAIGVAIAGLVIAAGSAVVQHRQAKKAARIQKEQAAQEQAVGSINARQARRAAARESRVKRAVLAQGAENLGVSGSSAEIGGASGLSSGVADVNARQSFESTAARGLSQTQQQLANVSSRIQTTQAIGNIGSSLFSSYSGSIFSAATE